MKQIVKVPVLLDKAGYFVLDERDGNSPLPSVLMRLLRESGAVGVDATRWLASSIRTMLDLYGNAEKERRRAPDGTAGLVLEFNADAGMTILFADSRVLARLNM